MMIGATEGSVTNESLESWQYVFRHGFAPNVSTASLEALRDALVNDDPRLIQGATCDPAPLKCFADETCKGACLVGFLGWHPDNEGCTVEQVEEAFAHLCFMADEVLGEPAACRWLLNWFDDSPREEMRSKMLPEVERILTERRLIEKAQSDNS